MAFRIDRASLGAVQELPGGGLRVPAQLARTGVLEYRRDGRLVREYRDPADVFAEDSLASFRGAPLTVGHPKVPVTIDTRAAVEVGHVETDGRQDGTWIGADLAVTHKDVVNQVSSKQLCEISCGYDVDLVEEPGITPDGQRYDARQTNIRINHVALLPSGHARAGAQAAIRLDCAIEIEPEETKLKTIFINGKEYRLDSDDLPKQINDLVALADSANVERARADAAEARADAAEADANAVKASLPALVASRVALEVQARKVLGAEARLDGKTDHEIRLEACAKAGREIRADRRDSEAYVEAAFDGAVRAAEGGQSAASAYHTPAKKPREDVSEEPELTPAQKHAAEQARRGTQGDE